MHVVWQTTSSSLRASASKNVILLCFTISKSNFIIIPYHFTIPPTSQNSIFIKILFFNLYLLFLSNRYFFQTRRDSIFLGLPIVFFFFLSLPQPLAQTTNTIKHKPSNPRCISLPPSTTTLSLNRICFP